MRVKELEAQLRALQDQAAKVKELESEVSLLKEEMAKFRDDEAAAAEARAAGSTGGDAVAAQAAEETCNKRVLEAEQQVATKALESCDARVLEVELQDAKKAAEQEETRLKELTAEKDAACEQRVSRALETTKKQSDGAGAATAECEQRISELEQVAWAKEEALEAGEKACAQRVKEAVAAEQATVAAQQAKEQPEGEGAGEAATAACDQRISVMEQAAKTKEEAGEKACVQRISEATEQCATAQEVKEQPSGAGQAVPEELTPVAACEQRISEAVEQTARAKEAEAEKACAHQVSEAAEQCAAAQQATEHPAGERKDKVIEEEETQRLREAAVAEARAERDAACDQRVVEAVEQAVEEKEKEKEKEALEVQERGSAVGDVVEARLCEKRLSELESAAKAEKEDGTRLREEAVAEARRERDAACEDRLTEFEQQLRGDTAVDEGSTKERPAVKWSKHVPEHLRHQLGGMFKGGMVVKGNLTTNDVEKDEEGNEVSRTVTTYEPNGRISQRYTTPDGAVTQTTYVPSGLSPEKEEEVSQGAGNGGSGGSGDQEEPWTEPKRASGPAPSTLDEKKSPQERAPGPAPDKETEKDGNATDDGMATPTTCAAKPPPSAGSVKLSEDTKRRGLLVHSLLELFCRSFRLLRDWIGLYSLRLRASPSPLFRSLSEFGDATQRGFEAFKLWAEELWLEFGPAETLWRLRDSLVRILDRADRRAEDALLFPELREAFPAQRDALPAPPERALGNDGPAPAATGQKDEAFFFVLGLDLTSTISAWPRLALIAWLGWLLWLILWRVLARPFIWLLVAPAVRLALGQAGGPGRRRDLKALGVTGLGDQAFPVERNFGVSFSDGPTLVMEF